MDERKIMRVIVYGRTGAASCPLRAHFFGDNDSFVIWPEEIRTDAEMDEFLAAPT